MADKTLTCKDCGKEFVFTEGEQEFYKEKGFENEPQRCQNVEEQENKKETTIEDSEDNRIMKKWLLSYFNSLLY